MTSHSCDEKREAAGKALKQFNNLSNVYIKALYHLSYLRNTHEFVSNRWIDIGCLTAGGLTRWPALGTWVVLPGCAVFGIRRFEVTFEIEHQEGKVKELESQMSDAENEYNEALKEYEECLEKNPKEDLKECSGCGDKYKPEYIKTCGGCGRDYCDTCFDAGIEAWELEQKEKENVA